LQLVLVVLVQTPQLQKLDLPQVLVDCMDCQFLVVELVEVQLIILQLHNLVVLEVEV